MAIRWRYIIIFFIVVYAVSIIGAGIMQDTYFQDEWANRIAAVSMADGNWVMPKYPGGYRPDSEDDYYYDKTPFYLLPRAIVYSITANPHPFFLVLPSVLMGWLVLFSFSSFLKKQKNGRILKAIGTLYMATSILFIYASLTQKNDMALFLFTTLSFFILVQIFNGHKKTLLFFLCLLGGVVIMGPAGLWPIIVGCFCMIVIDSDDFYTVLLSIKGWAILLIPLSIWLGAVYVVTPDARPLEEYIGFQIVERLSWGGGPGPGGSLTNFLILPFYIATSFMPWLLPILSGYYNGITKWSRQPRYIKISIVWVSVVTLGVSIAGTFAHRYLLPALTPAITVGSYRVKQAIRKKEYQSLLAYTGGTVFLLTALFVGYSHNPGSSIFHPYWFLPGQWDIIMASLIGGFSFVGTVYFLFKWDQNKNSLKPAFIVSTAGVLLMISLVLFNTIPYLNHYYTLSDPAIWGEKICRDLKSVYIHPDRDKYSYKQLKQLMKKEKICVFEINTPVKQPLNNINNYRTINYKCPYTQVSNIDIRVYLPNNINYKPKDECGINPNQFSASYHLLNTPILQ